MTTETACSPSISTDTQPSLSPRVLRWLDVQGFENVDAEILARNATRLRSVYLGCAALAVTGLLLHSVPFMWALVVVAGLGAASSVHPFDHVHNLVAHLRGIDPLPRRGKPGRFACALGATWMVGVIALWSAGLTGVGDALGWVLAGVATLVGSTNLCIPSYVYRGLFGFPAPRS